MYKYKITHVRACAQGAGSRGYAGPNEKRPLGTLEGVFTWLEAVLGTRRPKSPKNPVNGAVEDYPNLRLVREVAALDQSSSKMTVCL